MEYRHLWLRSHRQHAILRIRHEIIRACRDFFDDRGFILLDTPIFAPNACEGTTTLFETDYFGEKAYLTQSGQLYNEATAAAFGKVYCFGPTFRAEKSKTRRHLMEFWMVEPEVAFAELADVMALAEEFLTSIVARVLERRREELKVLERDMNKLEVVVAPFPRITYAEAVERLQKKGNPIQPGDDFGGDEETILSNEFDRPVIIHRYPTALKAFYMQNDPENSDLALCMDVLAPEGYGEIIGGGQRIHERDKLLARLKAHQLSEDAYRWYVELRTFGSVPHAGFGMGIERAVAWMCWLGCNQGLEGSISTGRPGREDTAWPSLKRVGQMGGSSRWIVTQQQWRPPGRHSARTAIGRWSCRLLMVMPRMWCEKRQSAISMVPCWTWVSPPCNWTRPPGGSVFWRTDRWTCGWTCGTPCRVRISSIACRRRS